MLTPDETLHPINMKMQTRMSFTSPKGCTAIKPLFNFIYNSLSSLSSIVSPISSMIAPCQLLTENLHSPFIMKMPPENIDILNQLKIYFVPIDQIMKNITVAPSAEPPRIPSDTPAALNDTVKYEDPWEVALVPAEATKFNMLSISRLHRPGHWMAPLLYCTNDDLDLVVTNCPCYRRPGHQSPSMCSSLKQNC